MHISKRYIADICLFVKYHTELHMSSRYLLERITMGKNLEPQIAFRCDKNTISKLEIIAEAHTRTRNQEMKHIIKQYIESYETEHGEIMIEEEQ